LRERNAGSGDCLFGPRTLADAFYLPVATRFRTYGVALSPRSAAYAEHVLRDEAFRHWEELICAEAARPFSRAPIDGIYPGTDTHGSDQA
jgi:glutathione S-transferase